MTDLRFLGDWGLWQGLMAALLLAGAVWALYLREVRRRNGVVKWLLPTLRSTAVFLVVMMLTGPVLHHRKLIGELVRLKVVIDASRSMALSDKDMDPGRKLLIAHRLGLLAPDVLDEELIKAADSLQCARETAAEMLRNSYGNIDLAEALGVFEKEIEDARDHLSRTRKESSIAIAEKGTILREFWTDIQGSNVASLAGSSAYPDKPSGTTYLDIFEAPTNWKDNYGTRIHGYIYPPTSGEYTFWISGDD